MNRRTILTISSAVTCAAVGGTAAWMLFSPKAPTDPIHVTTVGQGPTAPPGAPQGPGRGPGMRPGGPGVRPGGPGAGGQAPGGPAPGGPARGGGQPPVGHPAGGVFGNGKGPAAAAPTPPKPTARAIPNRKGWDPFRVPWQQPPTPIYVFGELEPIRLAPDEVEPIKVKPYEVREEAVARVSGIMSGDGIYAILELPEGDPVIVKPGSNVELPIAGGQTKRTYHVVSIKGETVVLRSVEGNATYTQEIPLSDVPLNGQSLGPRGGGPGSFGPGNFGPGTGGPGFPGRPGGGFPGGKNRPGAAGSAQ